MTGEPAILHWAIVVLVNAVFASVMFASVMFVGRRQMSSDEVVVAKGQS